MTTLSVAVVKSTRYVDLWACDITQDVFSLFKSSMMRCPPLGFAEYFKTDYIIVKESEEYPCMEIVYEWEKPVKNTMRFNKSNKNPGLPFLDESFHSDITMDEVSYFVDSIDWSKYNIVITINACVPERIIEKHKNTLWCYYVSENDESKISKVLSKYDVLLNQDVCIPQKSFSIGMPYSFIGPHTIENINSNYLKQPAIKNGLYVEINNTNERPVIHVQDDFYYISSEVKMPIFLHNQNIIENTKNLYMSKYFIKLFGRTIRGNSALEAASAGTLMLVNKKLITFSNLIHDFCNVTNQTDVINKINYFELNPSEYEKYVIYQRKMLETHYYKKPLDDLVLKYNLKTNPIFKKYLS